MPEIPVGPADSGAVSGRSPGAQAEQFARRRLEQAGVRFVAANMHIRGAEIDLIMRDRFTWVFVEVRYRRSDSYGSAAVCYGPRRSGWHSATPVSTPPLVVSILLPLPEAG